MRRAGLAALVLAALLGACGGGGSPAAAPPAATRPGVMAISLLPRLEPFPATPAAYEAVVDEAFRLGWDAGMRGFTGTWTWKVLEPQAGRYDAAKVGEVDAVAALTASRGMVNFVGLQLINTTALELPEGLADTAFDGAEMQTRFKALLARVITPNRGRIRYLSIGNEVDVWLRAHPAQWPRYRAFFNAMAAHARTLDPALQVGVTATAEGALSASTAELQQLNAAADVVILTHYPLQPGANGSVAVRPPADTARDFAAMVAFAAGKPLVMQEVGYPSAAANGSSEAQQAAFVGQVFAAWKQQGGRIPFLSFFMLHDFTPTMCAELGVYYGLSAAPGFVDFLCSLGLRHTDGTPRPAWATLQAEARAAGLP